MISQVQIRKQKLPSRLLLYVASHGFVQNLTCRNMLVEYRGWDITLGSVNAQRFIARPEGSCRVTGCVWHDGDLRAAYREANGFTHFPSQEPPHKQRLGWTAGAQSQEEGSISEQPRASQGLQVMHFSSLFLTLFICLLLLNVAFSLRQVIPGFGIFLSLPYEREGQVSLGCTSLGDGE